LTGDFSGPIIRARFRIVLVLVVVLVLGRTELRFEDEDEDEDEDEKHAEDEDDKNMMRTRLIIVLAALCLLGAATAEEKPAALQAPAAQPALASKVAVIPISGDIDYGLQKSLERRLDAALEQGAGVIIFEMDSYGGGLDPGAEMADMILAAGSKARTVAYVDKKAISAGALISLACQQIIMRRGTTLGDCEAIMITQSQTMEPAPEKIQTFVRVLMRKYSKANGYPTALCEKMVDPDMEVYQCTSASGTVRYLSGQELAEMKTDEKQGLETKLIAGKGKLLTMDDQEARAYGISRDSVSSLDDAVALVAAPGAQRIIADVNWSEEMVRFLNSAAVSSVLMIIGTIAVYICFKTPGFGAPEAVAIVCFGILFLSKYMVGLATVADMMLFVAGLGLIALEIFVWPGVGLLGIGGAICIILSLVLAFQNFTIPRPQTPEYDWQLTVLVHNLTSIFGSLLTATLLFMILVRFLPKTPFLKKLVLATQQSHAGGYVVVSAEQQGLVGMTGRSMSMLRPSGSAEIGGETYPVITDGEFIEPGTPIVVAEVSGNRIVVRKKN
jgi:membrane-bound serine protease (ClpP class)